MLIFWYRIQVISSIVLFLYIWSWFGIDYAKLLEQKEIQIIKSERIDTSFHLQPLLNSNTHWSAPDLSTLVSVKLPDSKDHFADAYMYFPTVEILVPIVSPSKEDKEKIFLWKSFNHFPYLENWAVHYFWDSPTRWNGNMVLAAHSSFKKSDLWRRKTIWQAFALLDIWDEIHYYEKINSKDYDFYQYRVEESFVTTPDDISILKNTREATLTAYTCRPFWTIENRLVIHAEMIARYENHEKLVIQAPSLLSTKSILPDSKTVNKVPKTPEGNEEQWNKSSIYHESAEILPTSTWDVSQNQEQSQVIEAPRIHSDYTTALLSARISKETRSTYSALISKVQRLVTISSLKDRSLIIGLRNALAHKVENTIQNISTSPNKEQEINKLIMYIVIYQSL